jgi:hypothetical protein
VKKLLLLLLLSGCVEPETRMCADFDTHTYVREKCIPMYGTLICAEQEVTEVYCKLYIEEEEN